MQHDGSPVSQSPNGAVLLETVQWSSLVDVDDVKPVDDHDYMVLEEIRQVLAKHGSTELLTPKGKALRSLQAGSCWFGPSGTDNFYHELIPNMNAGSCCPTPKISLASRKPRPSGC